MKQPSIPPELLAQARGYVRSDEELAGFLKRAGLSKSLSVIAFAHITGTTPSHAKRVIHANRAWAESRYADEGLHTSLTSALC